MSLIGKSLRRASAGPLGHDTAAVWTCASPPARLQGSTPELMPELMPELQRREGSPPRSSAPEEGEQIERVERKRAGARCGEGPWYTYATPSSPGRGVYRRGSPVGSLPRDRHRQTEPLDRATRALMSTASAVLQAVWWRHAAKSSMQECLPGPLSSGSPVPGILASANMSPWCTSLRDTVLSPSRHGSIGRMSLLRCAEH